MAVTESNYTGNGSTTNYSFTFPYLKTSDIKASINGAVTTAFTLANATTVQFNTAPANSATVRIFRETDDSDLEATFYAGSAIKSSDLNDNFNQTLYVVQESNNKIDAAWTEGDETITSSETWVSNDTRVSTTAAQDARIDSKIDTALTTDVAAGNKITVTDNSPGSGQITVGVTSGSLVNSDINASAAIAGTKITPNFGSQNIVTSGTVDGRDVSTDGSKLDGIESGATADQTNAEIRAAVEAASDSNVFTDADHSKLNAIEANATADQTAAEIRTLVESATDSNVFTDADHTKVNNAVTLTGIETISNKVLTFPQINEMSGTALVTTGTSTSDNKTYSAKRAGEIFYGKDTVGEIQSGETWSAGDDKVATTAAIDARIIDLVDDVGGFVPVANINSFPTTNPDAENGTGTIVSIKDAGGLVVQANGTSNNAQASGATVTITGLSSFASTTIASGFGMLVETTSTLHTYTFHRLVPKATEVTTVAGSISNVNTVAGAISNVNAVAGNSTNINAVAGNNSNVTAVAGNASNINSAVANASNINSAVSNASNITTTAGSISNVNTVAGSISNVNSVASNLSTVNDFAARYRTGSSNPTDSLDAGDLFFNTSANELKVYNGSAWQGGVTATGNLAALTGSTFTGDNLYNDGVKVKLGTGSDLEIYHDGTNSKIGNNTGELRLQNSTWIKYQSDNGHIFYNASASETLARFNNNAACELYYDNSKKLETNSAGVKVTGQIEADELYIRDSEKILLGTGSDLQIWHDATDSIIRNTTGDLYIQNSASDIEIAAEDNVYIKNYDGQTYARFMEDGASELYYDNSKKLETNSAGIHIFGNTGHADSAADLYGTDNDMSIYHSGSHGFILNGTGNLDLRSGEVGFYNHAGDETLAKFTGNGACSLYYDNSKLFETGPGYNLSNGDISPSATGTYNLGGTSAKWNNAYFAGNVYLYDSDKLILGDSGDLQIWHDSTNSNNKIQFDQQLLLRSHGSGASYENAAAFNKNGSVDLYYDDVKKFGTRVNGVDVLGTIYLADNDKVSFGGSSDLQIYHAGGTVNKIESGTNTLYIGGDHVELTNGAINEAYLKSFSNGAIELYYDNSKKLDTNSGGVKIYGNLDVDDNNKLRVGTSSDLQIFHDGSHSYIKDTGTGNFYITGSYLAFMNAAGNEYMLDGSENGAASLFYDGSNKLETNSTGVKVTGALTVDAFASTANNYITLRNGFSPNAAGGIGFMSTDHSGGNADGLAIYGHDGISLYHGQAKKFETHQYGIDVSGNIYIGDSGEGKLLIGAGEDLQMFHDSANSYINNNTGHFFIDTVYSTYFRKYGSGEEMAIFAPDGACSLYYDNSLKLQTISNGVYITNGDYKGGDNAKLNLGDSGDLLIYHDGSNSYVKHVSGATGDLLIFADGHDIELIPKSGEPGVMVKPNGAVELYYDGTKKFETTGSGVSVADNVRYLAGNGNDLQTYHDATNSFIDNRTGILYIRSVDNINIQKQLSDGSGVENMIQCHDDGAVKLYYNNALKFETVSDGVDVKGVLTTSGTHNYLKGSSTSTSTLTLKKSASGADSIDFLQCRRNSNGLYLTIEGDGDVKNYNNSYGSTSDSKLKENIVDANSQWDDIKAVKVRNFNFKASTGMPTDKHIGVIAQEIETVSAGLVKESIDRDPDTGKDLGTKTKSVKYSILYMKAIKALQEAMAKIEVLETKVAALESS